MVHPLLSSAHFLLLRLLSIYRDILSAEFLTQLGAPSSIINQLTCRHKKVIWFVLKYFKTGGKARESSVFKYASPPTFSGVHLLQSSASVVSSSSSTVTPSCKCYRVSSFSYRQNSATGVEHNPISWCTTLKAGCLKCHVNDYCELRLN